jgi:hypothetical protein
MTKWLWVVGVLVVLAVGMMWVAVPPPRGVVSAQVFQTGTPWPTGAPTLTPVPAPTTIPIPSPAPTPIIVLPTQYGASPDGLTYFLYLYDEKTNTVTFFTVDRRDGAVTNLFVLSAFHTSILSAGGVPGVGAGGDE